MILIIVYEKLKKNNIFTSRKAYLSFKIALSAQKKRAKEM